MGKTYFNRPESIGIPAYSEKGGYYTHDQIYLHYSPRCLAEFRAAARNKIKFIFDGNRVFGKNTSHGVSVRAKRVRERSATFHGAMKLQISLLVSIYSLFRVGSTSTFLGCIA